MRVLIACEFSGTVRQAFRALGHEAYSCDLLPDASGAGPEFHHVGDVRPLAYQRNYWDLMVAHPPCTFLTGAGLHWNKRRPERAAQTEDALTFVQTLLDAPIPRIVLENPVGCISTHIRKPDQIVQPYEFGDDASKKTCLWFKGVGPLAINPVDRFPGRIDFYNGDLVERWSNQTVSGQNKLGPSEDRWALRSLTYPGIARAIANLIPPA